MDSPDETTAPAPGAPSRWFQRVLPVTGIFLVLVAVAFLLSPSFRDQLRLSVSRQAQPYVELYFAKSTSGAPVPCPRRTKAVRVRFVLESHLDKRQPVKWRVVVNPAGQGRTLRTRGSIEVSPGAPTEVLKSIKLSRTEGYTIAVLLPGRNQHLLARCRGARS